MEKPGSREKPPGKFPFQSNTPGQEKQPVFLVCIIPPVRLDSLSGVVLIAATGDLPGNKTPILYLRPGPHVGQRSYDGITFLEWLRDRPQFHRVPKLVLNSSGMDSDREKAAELGACDRSTLKALFGEEDTSRFLALKNG